METFKTFLPGLSISNYGKVLNTFKNRQIKINDKGLFYFGEKRYNLVKVMLFVFKGQKIRKGYIKFIDGNTSNYHIDNIRYLTVLNKVNPPNYIDLDRIIHIHNGGVFKEYHKDVFIFRSYLKTILEMNCFFNHYKDHDYIDIFKIYFDIDTPGQYRLSKMFNYTQSDINSIVNYFLGLVIQEHRDNLKVYDNKMRVYESN